MKHNALNDIPIQELVKKAQEFQKLGIKWHFHIFLPWCKFNKKQGLHAFILETDGLAFVSYSKKRHLELGEKLVKLLYGNEILKKTTEEKSVPEEIQYILDKAQALNERQEAWEHHLLFPKCIFNKNNGKWANIFEDQEEIVESITFYEPISNLKKIERLYYAQKR